MPPVRRTRTRWLPPHRCALREGCSAEGLQGGCSCAGESRLALIQTKQPGFALLQRVTRRFPRRGSRSKGPNAQEADGPQHAHVRASARHRAACLELWEGVRGSVESVFFFVCVWGVQSSRKCLAEISRSPSQSVLQTLRTVDCFWVAFSCRI